MGLSSLPGYKERMLGHKEFASLMKNKSGRRTSQYGQSSIGGVREKSLGFQFKNKKGLRNLKLTSDISAISSQVDI